MQECFGGGRFKAGENLILGEVGVKTFFDPLGGDFAPQLTCKRSGNLS